MIGSVVVASNREPRLLRACLTSLRAQCDRRKVDLIVVRPRGVEPAAATLQREFSFARFLEAPAGSDIPRLRGVGLRAASGAATAMTEDHCVAADDWLDALAAALRGTDVVGGGMGNAQIDRAVDWAAFFAEYGFFSWARRRDSESGVPLLTGANVAYAASVRPRVAAWALEGVWENVAHARLCAEGADLRFEPAARIFQNHRYRFAAFCVDRYEHGRDYARTRLREDSRTRRFVMRGASPVLTPILVGRVARASAAMDRAAFVRALPFTVAFLGAWTAGEVVGYVRGPASQQV